LYFAYWFSPGRLVQDLNRPLNGWITHGSLDGHYELLFCHLLSRQRESSAARFSASAGALGSVVYSLSRCPLHVELALGG
jgi:hypothetical protein